MIDCPLCGAPVEIVQRFTLPATEATATLELERVVVRCVNWHWTSAGETELEQ